MKQVMIKLIKKYKWTLIIQLVFIFLNIYVLTWIPKITGNIIDSLSDIEANKEHILWLTVQLLGTSVLALVIRTFWKYFGTYNPRGMEVDLKSALFSQMMHMRIQDIQKRKNGEIMSLFVKCTSEIRSAVYTITSYGFRIVAIGLMAVISMSTYVDLKLTLITMIPVIIAGFAVVKIRKYIELNFKKSQKHFTQLSEFVQESTDAIKTTKAYAQEMSQLKRFINMNKKLKASNNGLDVHHTLLHTTVNICFGLCYAISLIYGSKLVLGGQITLGDFVAFNAYISLFYGPVNWIGSLAGKLKRAEVSYHILDEIFQVEREKLNLSQVSKKIPELKGNIEIKNLTYHYPDKFETVLEDINMQINHGEMIGIIGTVGSGKTTLMNLITGLYGVKNGHLFIDGKDINKIPIDTVRNNICYITQDNFLFSTTLKENVNLFRDEYKDKELIKSTKDALIYDDIKQMPDKLDTIIGERGTDLSGGQRQRVVISRAFLTNSNIVILDDTFSALDNRTEQKLLENIRELTKNKTCIIISNRISDVNTADKIFVLNEGRIVETGSHDELIENKNIYYKFYKQQSTKMENSLLS